MPSAGGQPSVWATVGALVKTAFARHQVVVVEREHRPQANLERLAGRVVAAELGAAQPELDDDRAVVVMGQLDQLVALVGEDRAAVDPVTHHVVTAVDDRTVGQFVAGVAERLDGAVPLLHVLALHVLDHDRFVALGVLCPMSSWLPHSLDAVCSSVRVWHERCTGNTDQWSDRR